VKRRWEFRADIGGLDSLDGNSCELLVSRGASSMAAEEGDLLSPIGNPSIVSGIWTSGLPSGLEKGDESLGMLRCCLTLLLRQRFQDAVAASEIPDSLSAEVLPVSFARLALFE